MTEPNLDTDPPSAPSMGTLLLVDDEPNILNALRRIFMPIGFNVLLAEGGRQGLDILATETVDLIVSDMRMPEMNGAEFLAKACSSHPDVPRILLTGHSELDAAIDAINRGQIVRYLTKPWNNMELVRVVQDALEQRNLRRDKARLESQVLSQFEALKELNASLERKVTERTASLELANQKLKRSFINSVKMFTNLIELRAPTIAGHSRRVAELARQLCRRLQVPEQEVQDIFLAGLLHDIGRLGMPDSLLTRPVVTFNAREKAEYSKYPVKGQLALAPLDQLAACGNIVRSHRERFDGRGFPDHLAGEHIPIGARILAVADDFDSMLMGVLLSRRLNRDEALSQLRDGANSLYDPKIVDALHFINQRDTLRPQILVPSDQLKVGMIVGSDIVNKEGMVILFHDQVLDDAGIARIRQAELENSALIPILSSSV